MTNSAHPQLTRQLRSKLLHGRCVCAQPVRRRAAKAGAKAKIGNRTFHAAGVTAYLKNGGTLERAQLIANHERPPTTKLHDRRKEEISVRRGGEECD